MAVNHRDFDGDITVIDFAIVFGAAALSSDKQKVVISYTGYAYPELANVELDTYEYSLDNGSTWTAMTPSGSMQLTGLAFTEAGTAHTFEWMAKDDEGMAFYNVTFRVRMNGVSGADETGLTYGSFYLERNVIDYTAEDAMQLSFPDSYPGMSGYELKQQLAPKMS